MGEFMEHHKELFLRRQFAVDGNKMTALHAVIKSADTERHFLHRDPESPAEPVKVALGQDAFVPIDPKAGNLFNEEIHGKWEQVSLIRHCITGVTRRQNDSDASR